MKSTPEVRFVKFCIISIQKVILTKISLNKNQSEPNLAITAMIQQLNYQVPQLSHCQSTFVGRCIKMIEVVSFRNPVRSQELVNEMCEVFQLLFQSFCGLRLAMTYPAYAIDFAFFAAPPPV